jgi:hypothetical protein
MEEMRKVDIFVVVGRVVVIPLMPQVCSASLGDGSD